jgi:hypothetical protein
VPRAGGAELRSGLWGSSARPGAPLCEGPAAPSYGARLWAAPRAAPNVHRAAKTPRPLPHPAAKENP